MAYIKQKAGIVAVERTTDGEDKQTTNEVAKTIVVVNIEGYEDDLSNHPAIVNFPDKFEVVEGEMEGAYEELNFVYSPPEE